MWSKKGLGKECSGSLVFKRKAEETREIKTLFPWKFGEENVLGSMVSFTKGRITGA